MTKRKRPNEEEDEDAKKRPCIVGCDVYKRLTADALTSVIERLTPDEALVLARVDKRLCEFVRGPPCYGYWKRHACREDLRVVIPPEWRCMRDVALWEKMRAHELYGRANCLFERLMEPRSVLCRYVGRVFAANALTTDGDELLLERIALDEAWIVGTALGNPTTIGYSMRRGYLPPRTWSRISLRMWKSHSMAGTKTNCLTVGNRGNLWVYAAWIRRALRDVITAVRTAREKKKEEEGEEEKKRKEKI